jgi:antitoxin ParD1/3/4
MRTTKLSLPDQLKASVDEQASLRGHRTSSDYLRELIRQDLDRVRLRNVLLAGAASTSMAPVRESYFEGLRQRVQEAGKAHGKV